MSDERVRDDNVAGLAREFDHPGGEAIDVRLLVEMFVAFGGATVREQGGQPRMTRVERAPDHRAALVSQVETRGGEAAHEPV